MAPPSRTLLALWELTAGHRRSFLVGALSLLIVDLLDLAPPAILAKVIDTAEGGRGWRPAFWFSVAYIGVSLLQNAFRYPLRMGFMGATAKSTAGLRSRYANHLLYISDHALGHLTMGDLLGRASGDVACVERGLANGLLFLLDCSIYLVGIPAAMVGISFDLSMIALASLLPIPALAWIMIPRISKGADELQQATDAFGSVLHESLSGIHTVRAYGIEEREISRLERMDAELSAKSLALSQGEIVLSTFTQGLVTISIALTLTVGGVRAIEGKIPVGRLIALLQYVGMMSWPLTGLSWAFLYYRKSGISLGRIHQVLDAREELVEGEQDLLPVRGHIEVRNLTFRHSGAEGPALDAVSFSVREGEKVAVLGPIGSGKSTLLALLARLVDPPPGTVYLDSRDVRAIKMTDLRRRIAFLSQDAFIFSGTVQENIVLGADQEQESLDDEALARAARVAQVGGTDFESGLESPAGERGRALSGGQRQRVALARALARHSDIVLLDDGLSALDAQTEEKLWVALRQWIGARTVILVTQRPRRALTADRVLYLENGRLVEQGVPSELLRSGGYFARFLDQQEMIEGVHGC